MIPLLLFISCSSNTQSNVFSDTSEDSTINEPSAINEPNEVDPNSLNGIPPQDPLPLIDFQALNSDGSARNQNDLLGSPTVMWFFPAADTPG